MVLLTSWDCIYRFGLATADPQTTWRYNLRWVVYRDFILKPIRSWPQWLGLVAESFWFIDFVTARACGSAGVKTNKTDAPF